MESNSLPPVLKEAPGLENLSALEQYLNNQIEANKPMDAAFVLYHRMAESIGAPSYPQMFELYFRLTEEILKKEPTGASLWASSIRERLALSEKKDFDNRLLPLLARYSPSSLAGYASAIETCLDNSAQSMVARGELLDKVMPLVVAGVKNAKFPSERYFAATLTDDDAQKYNYVDGMVNSVVRWAWKIADKDLSKGLHKKVHSYTRELLEPLAVYVDNGGPFNRTTYWAYEHAEGENAKFDVFQSAVDALKTLSNPQGCERNIRFFARGYLNDEKVSDSFRERGAVCVSAFLKELKGMDAASEYLGDFLSGCPQGSFQTLRCLQKKMALEAYRQKLGLPGPDVPQRA